MAIKISGSTIIDDGRSLVNVGVSTISGDLHVGTGVTVFSSTGIVSATAYHHSDGTFLGFRQDVQENLYAGTGAGAASDSDTCNNIAFGCNAGTALNAGDNNVLLGCFTGCNITSGGNNILIGSFEILALLVLISVIIFWIRRNILKIKRFLKDEMRGWPKLDADLILYFEIILMSLFLTMNGADYTIQLNYPENDIYVRAGSFPVSQFLVPIFQDFSLNHLMLIERISWWLHILGIFIFLNYLYYSKHLHILLAFPNTYYANLESKGKFKNINSITSEVKLMLDDNNNYEDNDGSEIETFGASDVTELSWIQLLNA